MIYSGQEKVVISIFRDPDPFEPLTEPQTHHGYLATVPPPPCLIIRSSSRTAPTK